jgi:sterol desaturase/sphingolipid hydroxylase (fatty acid hydroxylase superfamily)
VEAIAMDQILSALIPVVFFAMLVVERLFPAKPLPKVRFWLLKGIFFFVLTGAANAVLPVAIAHAFGGRSLVHLEWIGAIPGALVGFLAADFVGYWVHRTMHRHLRLWRWTHQMHHSAERMDLAGMTYSHPFDILLAFGLPGVATQLLGFSADAGALAGFLGFATAVFQHTNVRTPHWLGWLLTRPEAHGLHHERGVHAYNYANVPLWDVVFGTYRNPATFPEAYGFWDGASSRFGSMLIGRDVGERPRERRA